MNVPLPGIEGSRLRRVLAHANFPVFAIPPLRWIGLSGGYEYSYLGSALTDLALVYLHPDLEPPERIDVCSSDPDSLQRPTDLGQGGAVWWLDEAEVSESIERLHSIRFRLTVNSELEQIGRLVDRGHLWIEGESAEFQAWSFRGENLNVIRVWLPFGWITFSGWRVSMSELRRWTGTVRRLDREGDLLRQLEQAGGGFT
jgi:hypothetical protein